MTHTAYFTSKSHFRCVQHPRTLTNTEPIRNTPHITPSELHTCAAAGSPPGTPLFQGLFSHACEGHHLLPCPTPAFSRLVILGRKVRAPTSCFSEASIKLRQRRRQNTQCLAWLGWGLLGSGIGMMQSGKVRIMDFPASQTGTTLWASTWRNRGQHRTGRIRKSSTLFRGALSPPAARAPADSAALSRPLAGLELIQSAALELSLTGLSCLHA